MELNDILNRLNKLYDEGKEILATKYIPGSNWAITISKSKVDNEKFSKWQSK